MPTLGNEELVVKKEKCFVLFVFFMIQIGINFGEFNEMHHRVQTTPLTQTHIPLNTLY